MVFSKKNGWRWLPRGFSASTEAAVSVLPSAFMRRILEAQENFLAPLEPLMMANPG